MNSTPELLEKLRKIEIFQDFVEDTEYNNKILEKLCAIMVELEFKKGDIILKEDDHGETLHILAEGNVNILRTTMQGESFLVAKLRAEYNVFFGEMCLISKSERSATVAAASDCKTLMITSKDYLDLCDEEPDFGYKSIKRLTVRLINMLQKTNNDVKVLYQALLDEVENIN